jgi:hypothetical protein
MKQPLRVNLQLFADGAPDTSGQAPSIEDRLGAIFDSGDVTATIEPVIENSAQPEPTAEHTQQTEPTQEIQTQTVQAQEVEKPETEPSDGENLILGKFKNTDEVFKSYRNLESTLTKTFMDKSNLTKENAKLLAQIDELKKVPTAEPTIPTVEAEPAQVNAEEFLEGFYKDPMKAIQTIVESTTKKVTEQVRTEMQTKYEPVISKVEHREVQENWTNAVSDFAGKAPDFEQHLDGIFEYINKNKFGDEKSPDRITAVLEDGYRWAKGGIEIPQQQQVQQSVNPDDLLKDNAFIEKIIANPEIKNKILNQHMAGIKQNQPPQVISNNGGTSPANPPERPKNIEEAASLAGAIFDSNFG